MSNRKQHKYMNIEQVKEEKKLLEVLLGWLELMEKADALMCKAYHENLEHFKQYEAKHEEARLEYEALLSKLFLTKTQILLP